MHEQVYRSTSLRVIATCNTAACLVYFINICFQILWFVPPKNLTNKSLKITDLINRSLINQDSATTKGPSKFDFLACFVSDSFLKKKPSIHYDTLALVSTMTHWL